MRAQSGSPDEDLVVRAHGLSEHAWIPVWGITPSSYPECVPKMSSGFHRYDLAFPRNPHSFVSALSRALVILY